MPRSPLSRLLRSLPESRPAPPCVAVAVRAALPLVLVAAIAPPGSAIVHHVDPIAGSAAGDGTVLNPWLSLEQVWADGLIETRVWDELPYDPDDVLEPVNPGAPVQPGDTLWLYGGDHGAFDVRGAYNEQTITVAAAPGETPYLSRIELEAAQNWHFRGLTVRPSQWPSSGTLVRIQDHGWWGPTWDVVVEDCELYTALDASSWTAIDWIDNAWRGFNATGDRGEIRGNRLRNVRHGITVSGEDAVVSRNRIDGFSADGMRGLGDGGAFLYNVVMNAFVGSGHGDGNHDDGFQSWSNGPGGVGTGEVRDVVLRGNLFLNGEDPDHPLHSTLQGIGCFDGLFVNWTVEDNVVATDHWHGISFYGMVDSRIVNNTVLDINDSSPGPPWIRVTSSNGTPSENVVVANNLSTSYSLSGTNVLDASNRTIVDAASHFVAPPLDLTLLATSTALDAGDALHATARDRLGVARPQGALPDQGALERCPGCLFADGFESQDAYAWSRRSP